MTYFFSGVFVLDDDSAEIARRVCDEFGGRRGSIISPMRASVIAFGADYIRFEPPKVFDEALLRFGALFPAQTFVRLETSFFGGTIDIETGSIFRGGRVIARESSDEKSIIMPLFAQAGVSLESTSLPPLQRGWFNGKGDQKGALDRTYMRLALEVARAQVGRTGDNPAVGCVLTNEDNFSSIVECAATDVGGRPHAEERALELAADSAEGTTAYVTLEPCAKRSNGSASCADRLIDAGVSRVVIAAIDPHPFAAGAGVQRLREAGVSVEIGLLADEARAQNSGFFARWSKP